MPRETQIVGVYLAFLGRPFQFAVLDLQICCCGGTRLLIVRVFFIDSVDVARVKFDRQRIARDRAHEQNKTAVRPVVFAVN